MVWKLRGASFENLPPPRSSWSPSTYPNSWLSRPGRWALRALARRPTSVALWMRFRHCFVKKHISSTEWLPFFEASFSARCNYSIRCIRQKTTLWYLIPCGGSCLFTCKRFAGTPGGMNHDSDPCQVSVGKGDPTKIKSVRARNLQSQTICFRPPPLHWNVL